MPENPAPSRTRRPWLLLAAIVFAAATVLYSAVWMYYMRQAPPQSAVELGFQNNYRRDLGGDLITSVVPDSPAERAGLKPNDCIVAVNGNSMAASLAPETATWMAARPGDQVELTIQRPGEPHPRVLHATFRAREVTRPTRYLRLISWLDEITASFPVFFLVVGLPVLFMRLEDRNAWLLALLFSAFVAAPNVPSMATAPAPLRNYMLAYRALFDGMISALLYLFFTVFPTRSPIDRRWPWLKWALFAPAIVIVIGGFRVGDPRAPAFIVHWLGEKSTNIARLVYLYATAFLAPMVGPANVPTPPRTAEVNGKIE